MAGRANILYNYTNTDSTGNRSLLQGLTRLGGAIVCGWSVIMSNQSVEYQANNLSDTSNKYIDNNGPTGH